MRINFSAFRPVAYRPVYNQTKPITPPLSFKGADDDYFDLDKREKELLDKRSKWDKFWGNGKDEAKQQAWHELSGFNMNRASIEKQKNATIKAHEEALKAKDEALKLSKEKTELLEKQLAEAKKSGAKDDTIKDLKEQLKEAYSDNASAQKNYTAEAEKLKKTKEQQEILTTRQDGIGWNKMAGYETVKKQLEEVFINNLALEKGGHSPSFPNSILFYGPKGTGKTRFAEAFAEQSKCNFVTIDMMQDDEDILDELKTKAKLAKKLYDSSGEEKQRTIILLDEIDSIAKLSSSEKKEMEKEGRGFYDETNAGMLKKFLTNCADKYKCTIFMTTNYPLNIDSELLSDENTIPYQVFLDAPGKENAAAIFEYHLRGMTNQEINYDELADEVMAAKANNQAYSAGRIAKIVEDCVEDGKNTGQRITQSDVINKIRELGPDHDSETIKRFANEVKVMNEKLDEGKL